MISNPRIIARIDIKGNRVIKGIKFEGQKVYGDVNEFAKKYYQDGADEIIFIDTVASLYGRNKLDEVINYATKNIFVPICVEGGIKSLDNCKEILKKGADKIALNTNAILNKKLINECSLSIGSQSLVISIQAKKRSENKWEPLYLNGREPSRLDLIDWIKECEQLGAGEIFLSSVDKDGTEHGPDFNLINEASKAINLPIIASSGFRDLTDIENVFTKTDISAIAIGSSLHNGRININKIKKFLQDKND